MLTTSRRSVMYPLIVIKVEVTICRVFLDSGSESPNVSAVLASKINKKPKNKEPKENSNDVSYHNQMGRNI